MRLRYRFLFIITACLSTVAFAQAADWPTGSFVSTTAAVELRVNISGVNATTIDVTLNWPSSKALGIVAGGFSAPFTLQEGIDRTLYSEFISPDVSREIFFTE